MKCENVFINDPYEAKISDFGFSTIKDTSKNRTVGVGTASFIAPEVLFSSFEKDGETNTYDEKCDVYSFGIIMYVLLTGKIQPYGAKNDMEIIVNVQSNPNFRPSLEDIPKEAKSFLMENSWYQNLMEKCWSFDPDIRPSFNEIARILREKLKE